MLKKIIFLFLVAFGVGIFTVSNVTKAAVPEVSFNGDEAFQDPVTGDWIQPFELDENGEARFLTEEEYNSIIQLEDDEDSYDDVEEEDVFGTFDFRTYNIFKPSGGRTSVTKGGIKATADINCTTPTCSATVGVSATTSRAYSANVSTSSEKTAINTGAGYTVTSSATNSTTFQYNIKKGDKGYVQFKPYHWKVSGKLELRGNQGTGLISSKTSHVTFPKKLSNGKADGVYSFVYTKRG